MDCKIYWEIAPDKMLDCFHPRRAESGNNLFYAILHPYFAQFGKLRVRRNKVLWRLIATLAMR